jgi:hypothetical protein
MCTQYGRIHQEQQWRPEAAMLAARSNASLLALLLPLSHKRSQRSNPAQQQLLTPMGCTRLIERGYDWAALMACLGLARCGCGVSFYLHPDGMTGCAVLLYLYLRRRPRDNDNG